MLEPTPDQPRASLRRRAAYAVAVAGAGAAFALSLGGIATMRATLDADETAAIADKLRTERVVRDCGRDRAPLRDGREV